MAKRETAHSDLSESVDWGASVAPDVERMLLGLCVCRGDVFEDLGADIQPKHFYEPLHRRIWEITVAHREKRLAFNVDRLGTLLDVDSRFSKVGGRPYLARIVQACTMAEIGGHDPADIVRMVKDLYLRREVIAACADIMQEARAEGRTTGADLRGRLESRVFASDFDTSGSELSTLQAMTDKAMAKSAGGGADLISWGLRKVDERTSKLERGDFVIIAGRPSMGKTAVAGGIALAAARRGLGVIEIEGEMSEDQMARRHLSDVSHLMFGSLSPTYRDIRKGSLPVEQKDMLARARELIAEWPLAGVTRPGITCAQIRAMAMRQARDWAAQGKRLTFLFIDHIGLISSGQPALREIEELSFISKFLKALAIELQCVVVAMSQLSRKVEEREDKRPILSDLRSSGTLEQDADVVMFIFREKYYAERMAEPKDSEKRLAWLKAKASDEVELILAKVREGSPGTDRVWADVSRNAIRDEAPAVKDGVLFEDKDFIG